MFEPRPELWQEICQEIPHSPNQEAKVINLKLGGRASFSADYFFMRVAAAIALLLGCGLTLFLMKEQQPEAAETMAINSTLERIAPELPEVEAYYVNHIDAKKAELSNYDLKVLGLDGEQTIDAELAKLDSTYLELKKQLYTSPNTDDIMGAMIQNLQIRIEVLNRQLEVLQKLQQVQQQPNSEPKTDDATNV